MNKEQKQAAEIEKQLKIDCPTLSDDMIHSLANIKIDMAKHQKTESEPKAKEETAKPVQLDFWEEGKRAAPNALFRSALFPVLSTQEKEKRLFVRDAALFAISGVDVIFTGEQFDQSDLDVYLELLNLAKPFPLGTPVIFSAYSLLKALGLTVGGANYERLHSVLIRLRGGTVEITDHKKRYFGGLIEGGIRDEVGLEYEIIINPKFAALFGFGMWSTIDKPQRQELRRNPTAKALHAYYSTHAAPSAHSYDTLAAISGLKNSNRRQTKNTIIKAHEAMKATGFLTGYEANPETIKPIIKHTPSQNRHITMKIKAAKK